MIGHVIVNDVMYADDLAIVSPGSAGFQQLLNVCSDYGVKFDVKYNAKKSAVMICRAKGDKNLCFPTFYLSGRVLSVCCNTKYLGHIITDEMADDDDMYRQRRVLYTSQHVG